MDINDNLVKLASIGTAGISILAVFITGVIIYRLPNDVSREKTGILKFFIISCFFFVILSTGTGIANAIFNQQKINEKEQTLNNVTQKYETEKTNWLQYKSDVTNELTKIENQLNKPGANKDSISSKIKSLNIKTNKMYFSPITKPKTN